jgi:hypothetical protein
MVIYCINDFKKAFDDLMKKRAYRSLEGDIIKYFFDKKTEDLLSGKRLNLQQDAPYIKKRLEGSGGFRVYFLIKIVDKNLYLMFVHPKTGSEGSDNITDESKAKIYKEVLDCIKNNDLYKLTLSDDKTKINFIKEKSKVT